MLPLVQDSINRDLDVNDIEQQSTLYMFILLMFLLGLSLELNSGKCVEVLVQHYRFVCCKMSLTTNERANVTKHP